MEPLARDAVHLIADVSLKATVLVMAAMVPLTRWRNAGGRSFAWAAVLGVLVCLPVIAALDVGPALIGADTQQLPWTNAGSGWLSSLGRPAESTPTGLSWHHGVLAVYLAGLLIGLVRLAQSVRLARRLRDNAQLLDPGRLEKWQRCLGVRREVRWALCESVRSPALMGWWQPIILIPRAWSRASERTLDAVVLHELVHVRHAGAFWNLVGRVVRCVYWFHPLVRYVYRRWRRDAERACDDAAVFHLRGVQWYLDTLTAAARDALGYSATQPLVLGMARQADVVARARRIATRSGAPGAPGSSRAARAVAAIGLCLFAGCIGGLHVREPAAPVDVRVLADGSVMFGDTEVGAGQDCRKAAERAFRRTAATMVVIRADDAVPHARVVDVMDCARRAGFVNHRIDVPKEASPLGLAVEVLPDGTLQIEGRKATLAEFQAAAQEMHSTAGITLVSIRPHEGAAYSVVRDVMEAARRAGLTEVSVCEVPASNE